MPKYNEGLNAFWENVAEVCHEANAAFCRTLGDYSQPSWVDADDWQRDSAIAGVIFHMETKTPRKPEDSHDCWLEEKERTGWVYGPVKDAVAKTHPCIVPFDQLPIEQQLKDHLFSNVVKSFRPMYEKMFGETYRTH